MGGAALFLLFADKRVHPSPNPFPIPVMAIDSCVFLSSIGNIVFFFPVRPCDHRSLSVLHFSKLLFAAREGLAYVQLFVLFSVFSFVLVLPRLVRCRFSFSFLLSR